MNRSSYYDWAHRRQRRDLARERLKRMVAKLHADSREAMGARMISRHLKAMQLPVGRNKAGRLMHELGLFSRQRRPAGNRARGVEALIAPNLLDREFKVPAKNRVWCGDITFIASGKRWMYLAVVLDLHARRVVGWAFSLIADTNLVCKALRMAVGARGAQPGLMFHSDQGCQYTSHRFRADLEKYGFVQSMSGKGECWDNAPVERFFSTLKSEWMPRDGYKSPADAESDVLRFLMYYNRTRLHSSNGYLTPIAKEQKAAA